MPFQKYRESPRIYSLLTENRVIRSLSGCSESEVFKITGSGEPLYLKMKEYRGHDPFSYEAGVLEWLKGLLRIERFRRW